MFSLLFATKIHVNIYGWNSWSYTKEIISVCCVCVLRVRAGCGALCSCCLLCVCVLCVRVCDACSCSVCVLHMRAACVLRAACVCSVSVLCVRARALCTCCVCMLRVRSVCSAACVMVIMMSHWYRGGSIDPNCFPLLYRPSPLT